MEMFEKIKSNFINLMATARGSEKVIDFYYFSFLELFNILNL